jgi:acyl-coenzyme A thioesterase 13
MSSLTNTRPHSPVPSSTPSRPQSRKVWVDPASLPDYGDVSLITGNVPDYVKQLNSNTYFSYGVGDEDCFGHKVGKAVKFTEVNVDSQQGRQGRMEATTVAEVTVSKRKLPSPPHLAKIHRPNNRYAQRRWHAARRLCGIPD